MKYTVTYSCGHTGTIQLYGKTKEHKHQLRKYEEFFVCPDCYDNDINSINSKNFIENEMLYSEFKRNYKDCKTKRHSYNDKTKTIVVYIPINNPDNKNESVK